MSNESGAETRLRRRSSPRGISSDHVDHMTVVPILRTRAAPKLQHSQSRRRLTPLSLQIEPPYSSIHRQDVLLESRWSDVCICLAR